MISSMCDVTKVLHIDESKEETTYPFRFGTSKKLIYLNEKQLARIPYLRTLLAHEDHFASIKNENGEYVLGPPFRYNWFRVIVNTITTNHPSVLFSELVPDANVLKMLQLYDYLCIDRLPIPPLKYTQLNRTNPVDKSNKPEVAEYHRANLLEARDLAVQFVVAVKNNEYDLDHYETVERIFCLVEIIVSNHHIFTHNLRHHTLIIVEKYCFPFFSYKQRCQLNIAQDLLRSGKRMSSICSDGDNLVLPKNFNNSFAWKEGHQSNNESIDDRFRRSRIEDWDYTSMHRHSFDDFYFSRLYVQPDLWRSDYLFYLFNPLYRLESQDEIFTLTEAKSARSGRFNTLPKRIEVDRFKHRSGPKMQKHR